AKAGSFARRLVKVARWTPSWRAARRALPVRASAARKARFSSAWRRRKGRGMVTASQAKSYIATGLGVADRAGALPGDLDGWCGQRRKGAKAQRRRSRGEAAPQGRGLGEAASSLRAASPQVGALRAFAWEKWRSGGGACPIRRLISGLV